MAFPAYGKLILNSFTEKPESPVIRTEMDDGPPKESIVKSRVMVPRTVTYHFTGLEYAQFKTWFAAEARGGLFFDWVDPVDGATKQVRMRLSVYEAKPKSRGEGAELGWDVAFTLEGWDS